jgi:hypothetical protein
LRESLPLEDSNKQVDLAVILPLVQDINNRMISFEKRVVTQSAQESFTQALLHNQN